MHLRISKSQEHEKENEKKKKGKGKKKEQEKKKKEKEEWMKKVCVVPLSIWQCPNGVRVPVPWHRSFWEQL